MKILTSLLLLVTLLLISFSGAPAEAIFQPVIGISYQPTEYVVIVTATLTNPHKSVCMISQVDSGNFNFTVCEFGTVSYFCHLPLAPADTTVAWAVNATTGNGCNGAFTPGPSGSFPSREAPPTAVRVVRARVYIKTWIADLYNFISQNIFQR